MSPQDNGWTSIDRGVRKNAAMRLVTQQTTNNRRHQSVQQYKSVGFFTRVIFPRNVLVAEGESGYTCASCSGFRQIKKKKNGQDAFFLSQPLNKLLQMRSNFVENISFKHRYSTAFFFLV